MNSKLRINIVSALSSAHHKRNFFFSLKFHEFKNLEIRLNNKFEKI